MLPLLEMENSFNEKLFQSPSPVLPHSRSLPYNANRLPILYCLCTTWRLVPPQPSNHMVPTRKVRIVSHHESNDAGREIEVKVLREL